MHLGDVLEPLKCLSEALAYGEPLFDVAFKLALSYSPLTIARARLPVVLKLPLGLKALCSLDMLLETWRNILHVFYYRDYEQVPGFTPRKGWIVVDVGAYLGLYTLRAAKLVGEEGLVVAVEPLERSFKLLAANVRLNGLGNVAALRRCVASKEGVRKLYVPERLVNATLVRRYAEAMGGIRRAIKAQAITLPDILKRVDPVDLLKLDVEGAEVEILESSKGWIKPSRVRRVVVEVHTDVANPRSVASILEEEGYEVAIYLPEGAPTQAIVYGAEELAGL